MLNKIIFKIIKKIVLFLKKINLEKFLFDKLIFYIGLNQILENRKNYNDVKNIQEIELMYKKNLRYLMFYRFKEEIKTTIKKRITGSKLIYDSSNWLIYDLALDLQKN